MNEKKNKDKRSNKLYNRRPTVLHLFAGAGGGILADILLGHRTICAVEINKYRRDILLRKQQDKIIPWFPIFKNVREFDGRLWSGAVDIVAGGFPCQPYSTAGLRKGKEDSRNLWPDTLRILGEVGPKIAFLENVPGLLSFDYFGRIIGDLATLGYSIEWDVISAASIGAPHLRRRLWILAWHPDRIAGAEIGEIQKGKGSDPPGGGGHGRVPADAHGARERAVRELHQEDHSEAITDASCGRRSRRTEQECYAHQDARREVIQRCNAIESGETRVSADRMCQHRTAGRIKVKCPIVRVVGRIDRGPWTSEPGVRGVAHGIPKRMERISSLGDAQVPQVAAVAFLILMHRAGLMSGGIVRG